ncbi:MAG: ABC transporter permease [Acidobacteriota bacterium]
MQDLRHAIRALRASPGFAALAVLTLAAGIVGNTVIFSVVSAVLLRPLPYGSPEQLVMFWETNAELQRAHDASSPANFLDLLREDTGLETMAAWFSTARTIQGQDDAEQVNSAQVTSAFFDVLQVAPAHGRLFSAGDTAGAALDGTGQYHSGDRVVVISDGLWRRRFGGRTDVGGEIVTINRAPWRIIGVLPPGFAMPSGDMDLWMPWDPAPSLARGNTRDSRFVRVVGRLAPATSLTQAQERIRSIYARLADAYPKANRGWSATLTPLHEEVVGDARQGLVAMSSSARASRAGCGAPRTRRSASA